MTQVFLNVLDGMNVEYELIDRRFSKSVSEVGAFNLRKVAAGAGLIYRAFRASRRADIDFCVFFTTNRSFSFVVDVILSMIFRSANFPVIAYVHTLGYADLAKKSSIHLWAVKQLIGSSERVVTLGPAIVEDVAPFSRNEVISIHNTLPFSPDVGPTFRKSSGRMLFFSNLIAEKGIDEFTALALQLAPKFPNARFSIAGAESYSGQIAEIESQIVASRLSGSVRVLGAISPDEKWQLLQDHDLLVFPSQYKFEAQPLSIIEAAASHVATVAYSVGGISDVVEAGRSGVLVAAGDTKAFEREVAALLADSASLDLYRHGAREVYLERFSLETYATRWAHVIRQLMDR